MAQRSFFYVEATTKLTVSAGKLRGMVLFGQPLDCQDACGMLNGSKWVRTDRSKKWVEVGLFPYFRCD